MQHCHLEINTVPIQTWLRPEIKFDSTEQAIINAEIRTLLQLGVVEHAVHSPGDFISNMFVSKKKSGKYRMIHNLKGLNKHIEYHHFKMDPMWSAVRLMTPECYTASINLKDAYYSVPVGIEHRQGTLFQYT